VILPVFGNDGSYEQDDVAAVQSYLAKSDTVTVYYTPSSKLDSREVVRHLTLSCLRRHLLLQNRSRLTASDVLVTTAPYYSTLGLAAGPLAAASVSAKYVLPNKTFDASKTLVGRLVSKKRLSSWCLLNTWTLLKAELAKDEAKPEAKRAV
jgi:acyl-CoA synthetase (AMP-forming)/AMP-acid ligase II